MTSAALQLHAQPVSVVTVENGAQLLHGRSGSSSKTYEWIIPLTGNVNGEEITIFVVPVGLGRAQLLWDERGGTFVLGPTYTDFSFRNDLGRFQVRFGVDVTVLDHRSGRPVEPQWFQDLEIGQTGAIVGVTGSGPVTLRNFDPREPTGLADVAVARSKGNPRMVGTVRVVREGSTEYIAGDHDAPVSDRFPRIKSCQVMGHGGSQEILFGSRNGGFVALIPTSWGTWVAGPSEFSEIRVRPGRIEGSIGGAWVHIDRRTGLAHELAQTDRETEAPYVLPPQLRHEHRDLLGGRVQRVGDIEYFIDNSGVPVSDIFEKIEVYSFSGGQRAVGVFHGKQYLLGVSNTPTPQYSKPSTGHKEICFDEALGVFLGKNGDKRYVLSNATGERLHEKPIERIERTPHGVELIETYTPSFLTQLRSFQFGPRTRSTPLSPSADTQSARQTRSTPEGADAVLSGWLRMLGELRFGDVAYHNVAEFKDAFRGDLRGIVVTDPKGIRHGILIRQDEDQDLSVIVAQRGVGLIAIENPKFADLYFDNSIGHLVGRMRDESHIHYLVSLSKIENQPRHVMDTNAESGGLDFTLGRSLEYFESAVDGVYNPAHFQRILVVTDGQVQETNRPAWQQSLIAANWLAHKI